MLQDPAKLGLLTERFPTLAGDDGRFLERLARHAGLARLDAGDYVCHEGTECAHLALVLDGWARVFKSGENGREITLYRVGSGESCILTASCILSGKPFPAFAVCETPVEAVVIPAPLVVQWLAESRPWRDYLFGLVADRLDRVIGVVEDVVFRRMDQRIGAYLLEHADVRARLNVTHQQIADDLGTSREVVSRILKDLENRQLIRTSRGLVELPAPDILRDALADA